MAVTINQPSNTIKFMALAGCCIAAIAIAFTGSKEEAKVSHANASGYGFIKSLEGTAIPGQTQSNSGDLILNLDLLRQFDYFLTGVGEKTPEQIKPIIIEQLSKGLNPSGKARLIEIINKYFAFKLELSRIPPATPGTEDFLHLRKQQDQVRSRHFTPAEISALFPPPDPTEEYTLRRLQIAYDKSLTQDQRDERIKQLMDTAPQSVRLDFEKPVEHLSVSQAVDRARANGASEAQVFEIRKSMVGEDAAKRLSLVDKENAEWDAKVRDYQALKKTNPEAAQTMKQSQFSPSEQLRLSAYE